MPIVVGVLLAIAIAALAKFTRFDEERSFYDQDPRNGAD